VPTGLWNECLGLFEGDRELAWRWLTSPSLAFGGKRPIDVAKTEHGKVADLIGRLEHGVLS
jgi:putative toxin-antitoxin system antitoxin component (TIGR02293 family)